MVSIKQLIHALAVEQHLHFKKAADACAISQSALSNSINELEKQLGFHIFERDNKKVLVTPLGAQVLKKARDIHLQITDLSKMAEALANPLTTELSIGVIPTIAPFLLPRVLNRIRSDYPDLTLTVVEDQSHVLVEQVTKGFLDTAILALPYDCQGLLSFTFWQEDFYWTTHCDDMLSDHTVIHANEIKHSNLMLLKDGHCLKDHALSVCQLSSDGAFSLGGTSLTTLVELVAGKLGTTLVPEIALDQLVKSNPCLKAIRINEPGPHRQFAFVVRPNYPSIHNIEILKDLIHDQLTQQLRLTDDGKK